MAEKQRQLPSWMALQERVKVKAQTSTSSRKARERVGRTVFYCMNEKELVEAAISYLTEDVTGGEHAPLHTDQQVNDSVTNCRLKTKDGFTKEEKRRVSEPEAVEESSCEGHERTCVSETDLDVSEEETLPYADHQGEQQEAMGRGTGPDQGHGSPVVPIQEGESPEDQSPSTTADDDPLRLVREIFFT